MLTQPAKRLKSHHFGVTIPEKSNKREREGGMLIVIVLLVLILGGIAAVSDKLNRIIELLEERQ